MLFTFKDLCVQSCPVHPYFICISVSLDSAVLYKRYHYFLVLISCIHKQEIVFLHLLLLGFYAFGACTIRLGIKEGIQAVKHCFSS